MNRIRDEGGKTIAEALKTNTSLTQLSFFSNENCTGYFVSLFYPFSDNAIGDEGAKAIGESLKVNTSLTELTLG